MERSPRQARRSRGNLLPRFVVRPLPFSCWTACFSSEPRTKRLQPDSKRYLEFESVSKEGRCFRVSPQVWHIWTPSLSQPPLFAPTKLHLESIYSCLLEIRKRRATLRAGSTLRLH